MFTFGARIGAAAACANKALRIPLVVHMLGRTRLRAKASRDQIASAGAAPLAPYRSAMSERIREIVDLPVSFVHEGVHFLNRCTKPDRKGAFAQ